MLGKAAEAGERGVDLLVAEDVDLPAGLADPRDLVTIVGNLLDNAIDAAAEGRAPRWVRFEARTSGPERNELQLQVADSGPGLTRSRRGGRSSAGTRPSRPTGCWAAESGWPWSRRRRTGTAARWTSATKRARCSP